MSGFKDVKKNFGKLAKKYGNVQRTKQRQRMQGITRSFESPGGKTASKYEDAMLSGSYGDWIRKMAAHGNKKYGSNKK